MDKYSGKKLDRRYEIHELIGVGGMAMVYRAYDTIDDRTVAIKILKDEFLDNEEFKRRFKNESKAIAVLTHENIVRVYDVSFGDVIQYIVMEYIDGVSLKEYIETREEINSKVALQITVQILEALEHAHNKGVIHRDIKPQNIMLLPNGTIKVTDFGIARFSSTDTRTMTDKAIGSVHYIAPEQAKGEFTDGRSDIYSVGVILYEMITGKLPFEADNAVSVAIMQLQSKPKMPREINPAVPIGLEEITIQAMQKDPNNRYKSAKAMLSDILDFTMDESRIFGYRYILPEPKNIKKEAIISDDDMQVNRYNTGNMASFQDAAEKRRSPASSVLIGTLISLALVLVVCVSIGIFSAFQGDVATEVEIPDLVGMNIDEVQNNPEYKFTWEIKNTYDEEKEIGEITDQQPEPSAKTVREGSVMILTVNTTETAVSVPYVNREPEETAKQKIEQKDLKTKIVYVENEDVATGMVVDTLPKAGVQAPIGTEVTIFVSKTLLKDEKPVAVPNVIGKSLEDATAQLVDLGFEVDYEYNEVVDKPENTVIGQSPLYDIELERGSTIDLVVAKGLTKESTVKISVNLPEDVESEVFVRVTVDGVVDENYSKTVVPIYNPVYEIEVTGEGQVKVVVDLDSKIYREYEVDFETQTVKTIEYEYEDETEYVEPTTSLTDPIYDGEDTTDDSSDDNWWPF